MSELRVHSVEVVRTPSCPRLRVHGVELSRVPAVASRRLAVHSIWLTSGYEPPLSLGARRVRWQGKWVPVVRRVRWDGQWI